MRALLKSFIGVAGIALAAQAAAQVTFYSDEGFHGRPFFADRTVSNLDDTGFNDRASSAVVERGNWQVCEDANFAGRCVILQPGNYATLDGFGLNNRISSIRPIAQNTYYQTAPAPIAQQSYDYNRRADERLYDVPVTSVRAVVGPPEQRCWVERQQVVEDRGANVPGAIVGGIIGGVLGHQIGSGRGRDVATVGGAVAGAAVGANVNRGAGTVYDRDVQRCENVSSNARPDYWDVTYQFRGVEHHVQLSSPPGQTITVNENGEPRV
jgi:uncharacterized protein YcfJ